MAITMTKLGEQEKKKSPLSSSFSGGLAFVDGDEANVGRKRRGKPSMISLTREENKIDSQATILYL